MNPADMVAFLEADESSADALLPPAHSYADTMVRLRNEVAASAKANMSFEAQLSTLRGDVADLQQSLRDRRKDLADNLAVIGSVNVSILCDPAKMRQRCAEAAKAEDIASEKLLADVISGSMPVSTFVRQYITTRCQHHRLVMAQYAE